MYFAGLAFKISLVPFHFWTADVYEGAPISIASYLSVISKGAAVFILMILLFTVLMISFASCGQKKNDKSAGQDSAAVISLISAS